MVGWFDLDALPIMHQARRERLAAAKTGFDMGIPFNELNRILDLGYLPSKYQPLQSASSAAGNTRSEPCAARRSLDCKEPTSEASTSSPSPDGKTPGSEDPISPAPNDGRLPTDGTQPIQNQKSKIENDLAPLQLPRELINTVGSAPSAPPPQTRTQSQT